MSTKTSIKRIALVAVSALGFGLLSVIPATAASVTGTVSPVRVTFTGATQDTTPTASISWTSSAALGGNETAVLSLTTAPSAAARVKLDVVGNIGAALAAFDTAGTNGSAKLGTDSAAITLTGMSVASGGTASLAIQADTAGTFAGTVTVWDAGASAVDTVSFSFTTRGAVSSFTFTSDVTETSPGGAITTTTTLLDSNGNVTQPLTVDSVALTDGTADGSFATASLAATGSGAATLYDGVAVSVYTNISTASSSATLTATPAGTLGTIAAKTIAVTTSATSVNATAVTAYTTATPSNAAAQTGTLGGGNLAQAIPTGTADVSITVTGSNSVTHRFSIVASAGTVDGTAYTTTVYKNVATSSTGSGTLSFTLGGTATAVGATVTINQVTVQNAAVANTQIVLTQTNGAISASTPTLSPSGGVVRAIGTSTDVTVTVKDQYGTALGSGFVIRAYRGNSTALANLLDTETTGTAGTAVLTVTNVSGITSGTAETYTFTYTAPGASSATTITSTGPTITYTTGGTITSLSVAISGTTGATSPVTDTTLDSAVTIYPAIVVPTDGTANDASGDQIYTVSTAAVTGTANATAELITLTANATADNTVTWTMDTGAFISADNSAAWSESLSTLTVADNTAVYVYATKTGLHTITATSGGKTVTIKFWAYNLAADAYNVSASAAATTLSPSANTIVTMTVKDVFGNVVDAADARLTATASDKVRLAGQALSQSLNTAADGTVQFTVVADAATGTGTITMAPTGTETGSTNPFSSTYVKPTGAADPVKSYTLTFTVAGSTQKTNDEVYAQAVKAEDAAKLANTTATTAGTKADAAKTEAAAATAAATTAGTKADAAKDAAAKAGTDAVAAAGAAKTEAAAATAKAAEALTAATTAGTKADAAKDAADAAKAAAAKAGTDAVAAADAAKAEAAKATAASAANAVEIAKILAAVTALNANTSAADAYDAALEAIDAANAATDAAGLAAEAADAATVAAEEARDAADAATAAVEELATQVSTLLAAMRAQLTTLANTIAKIAKKVKA